ncbi:MAG: hydroxymethylbilane synthase [Ignavibacteria bacterium]|nr:hydroxymethylbilane synthase [Ignavibacteria bacterium]
MTKPLRIGTRGSDLALWQSNHIKARLSQAFPDLAIELLIIKTTGDRILDSPLSKIGDKGLFTKEIEHALLSHEIDLAVHSLKDLPTKLPEGLVIGAITEREDVRDVFIAHPSKPVQSIKELPQGAKVATGSLRRRCQLLHVRPDLEIVDLRGNLNTRLHKLEQSDWNGIVLAGAGVRRLGWTDRIAEEIPLDVMLPAVGQGALAVEIRDADAPLRDLLKVVHHDATAAATRGERAFLRHLEGGCQIPIGTYGRIEESRFKMDGLIGSLDGHRVVRGSVSGVPAEAEALGTGLAKELLERGGREILEEIRKGDEE